MKLRIVCDENGKFYLQEKVPFLPFWLDFEEGHLGIRYHDSFDDALKLKCWYENEALERKEKIKKAKEILKNRSQDCSELRG